jgi:hypothetical protein
MNSRAAIPVFVLLFLAACEYSHSIDLEQVTNLKFRPMFGVVHAIDSSDSEYQELQQFLDANRDGWRRFDGLVPNAESVFTSDQFVLYIADGSVYLAERGGELLVKPLSAGVAD